MNTDTKLAIKSTSSNNTEQIAEQIGKKLKGGETIVLVGDLGGGKTVFAKGLARGADSQDRVASPTFTLTKVYKCSKFDIQHFDFYRLNDPGIMALEICEVLGDRNNVVIIEWADIIRDILPNQLIEVNIENLGEDERNIEIIYPAKLGYLIKGLK